MTGETLFCYYGIVPDFGEKRSRRFLIALVIGGLLGVVVGIAGKALLRKNTEGGDGAPGTNDVSGKDHMTTDGQDSVAWAYARAYQEGDWARAIELTIWMEERLVFVARTGTPEDVVAERKRLIEQISTRVLTDMQLRDAGVDDQYIFAPGVRLEHVLDDSGRDDLAAEVAWRTWFNVIYPSREKALLDWDGMPIHSVYVGVNVSLDGRILKAGIIGNLDIDWDSIRYDWPSQQGE